MSACCSALAVSGYVAAMVCSRVQVERPSCSTSGGQSGGTSLGEGLEGEARGTVGVVIVVDGDVDVDVEEVVEEEREVSALACFVRARQAAAEVQVRQLDGWGQSLCEF